MNFLCFAVFKTRNIYVPLSLIKHNVVPKANVISRHNNRSFSAGQFPIDNIRNLKKDVLVYTFEKTKLFKCLTIFGIAQLGIWVYYAGYVFTSLRDISKSEIKTEDIFTESTLWRRINLGDIKYRIISTVLCLGVGIVTALITYALPLRIVKELTLCKGGTVASFVTYGPFGKTRQFETPLKKISCVIARGEAKSYIPIKVKDRWFYYLIDCKGQFLQTKLFDYTVGTKTVKAY